MIHTDIHMLKGMIYLIEPRGLETNLRDDCKPGLYGSTLGRRVTSEDSLCYQQFLLKINRGKFGVVKRFL